MSTLSKKKVIAITGSMGSGKSTVSMILKESYPVVDCDQINRELLEINNEGYNRLKELDYISFDENGNIDKVHMARVVFSNAEKKKEVESILHPLIFKKVDEWVEKQVSNIVFVEVPILFECHAENRFDEVWCIVCSQEIALDRLQKGRNISKEHAISRLKTQLSPEYKMSKSDVVIFNDGDINDLRNNIKKEESKWI